MSPIQLASLHMQWQPRFVAVTDVADARNLSKYSDEATGVVQRCLSNGIRVNYKVLNCFRATDRLGWCNVFNCTQTLQERESYGVPSIS